MLRARLKGEHGPLLVMLHWLGGSARTWTDVSDGLAARGVRCAALDLPGFGRAADTAGFDVESMTDAVVETIQSLRREGRGAAAVPWVLAGHSMGGKVAAVVARRALDGRSGLENLRALVLVSPSPPGPEPMRESKRRSMLASLGRSEGPREDRAHAARLLDENTGNLPLPHALKERAVDGIVTMNRTAFRAWMEHGSKEDWSGRVGNLDLPAMVFAGTDDSALGPAAQRKHTLPHLPQGELVELEGAGHLPPLERSGELVERLTQFLADIGLRLATPAQTPGRAFTSLLNSTHTSPRTREVMADRVAGSEDWNRTPTVFAAGEFRTVRALAERVVPNAGFDLAACLDAQLAARTGDGWRFAALPPDIEAAHRGLLSLNLAARRAHGVPFVSLYPGQQDTLLHEAAAGTLGRGLLGSLGIGDAADALAATGMTLWFEDLRADLTRWYIADPRTMERLGYTGFADDLGFTRIRIGQTEEFER